MNLSERWLISDLHFGHKNIIHYCNRPYASVDEMNEALIDNWNSVIKQHHVVYVLGDVCLNPAKYLHLIGKCNGSKRLILGNHDNATIQEYLKYFHRVYAMRIIGTSILTHIPVHTSQLDRFKFCIHGHIHTHNIVDSQGIKDKRYINVSVEQINYTPVNFDDVRSKYFNE